MNPKHKKISIQKQNSKAQSFLLSYKGKKIRLCSDDSIDMIRLYNEFGLDFHFEATDNPKILRFESIGHRLFMIKSFPTSMYVKLPEKGNWASLLDMERVEIKTSILVKIEKHEFIIEKTDSTTQSKTGNLSFQVDNILSTPTLPCTRSQSRINFYGQNNEKSDINKRKTRSTSRNYPFERSKSFEVIDTEDRANFVDSSTLRRSKTSIYDQDKYSEKASLSTSQETSHEEENYFRSTMKKVKKNETASKVKCENSDQTDGKCPICLGEFSREIGRLDSCSHIFCYKCILEWSSLASECPLCKTQFLKLSKSTSTGQIKDTIKVKVKKFTFEESLEDLIDPDSDDHCYVCDGRDDLEHMIICDKCKFKCCHIYCCDPPLESIPLEDWFCIFCIERPRRRNNSTSNNGNSIITPTREKKPNNIQKSDKKSRDSLSPPRKMPTTQIKRSYTTRSNSILNEKKSTQRKNRYPLRSQTFDIEKISK